MRRTLILLLILTLALAACGSDDTDGGGDGASTDNSSSSNGDSPPAATTPEVTGPTLTAIVLAATQSAVGGGIATPEPFELTATAFVAQATANAGNPATNCETGLITNMDADAGNRLDTALASRDLDAEPSTVMVTENVLDCQTSSIVNAFISVPISVADTADDATLGNTAAQALAAFVATDLPQPATLSMQFQAGTRQRSLTANFDAAQTYVNDGLTGAALIEALGG